jgi:hypothetical protein
MWVVLCPVLNTEGYLDRINSLTQEQLLALDLDTVEIVLNDDVVNEEATYANGALKAPDQVRNALIASVHTLDELSKTDEIDMLWVVGQAWFVMAPHGDGEIPAGYDEFVLLANSITTDEETAVFGKNRADGTPWLEVLHQ